MQSGRPGIVQTDVRLQRSTEDNYISLERNRYPNQFAFQGHQNWTPLRAREIRELGITAQLGYGRLILILAARHCFSQINSSFLNQ
jgi:hypothetical protein